MVSVWPTVEINSENYLEMVKEGFWLERNVGFLQFSLFEESTPILMLLILRLENLSGRKLRKIIISMV